MFKVENNVPEVYVQESRDFQLLSRLYDLVFQATRYSIDNMRQTSSTMNCNGNLLPLVGTKVGFFESVNIDDETYRQVLSAFPHIVRNKGSMKGVDQVVALFQRLVNTDVYATYNQEEKVITLIFNKYSPNVDLLYKLVEYIRPAGVAIDYVITVNIDLVARPDYTSGDALSVSLCKPDKLDDKPGGNVYSKIKSSDNSDPDNSGRRVGVAQVYKNETKEEDEVKQ